MSYEGYMDVICLNGHLRHYDCFDYHDDILCPVCAAGVCHQRGVDETNGCSPDEPWTVSYPYKTLTPAEYETCKCCMRTSITKEATFEVPTEAELDNFNRLDKMFPEEES